MPTQREIKIAAEIARTSPVPLDQMPYTEAFELVYSRFRDRIQRDVSRNECWLAFLSARKRGEVGSLRRRSRSRGLATDKKDDRS